MSTLRTLRWLVNDNKIIVLRHIKLLRYKQNWLFCQLNLFINWLFQYIPYKQCLIKSKIIHTSEARTKSFRTPAAALRTNPLSGKLDSTFGKSLRLIKLPRREHPTGICHWGNPLEDRPRTCTWTIMTGRRMKCLRRGPKEKECQWWTYTRWKFWAKVDTTTKTAISDASTTRTSWNSRTMRTRTSREAGSLPKDISISNKKTYPLSLKRAGKSTRCPSKC